MSGTDSTGTNEPQDDQTTTDPSAKSLEQQIEALRKSLDAERRDHRQTRKRFRDVDPEEYDKLKKTVEEQREAKALKEKDIEALQRQWQESAAKKEADWTAKEHRLRAAIWESTVREAGTRALVKHGGNPALLLHIVEKRADLEETDEGYKVYAKGLDGQRMHRDDGHPASLEDVVVQMKGDPNLAGAFKLEQKPGTGLTTPASSDSKVLKRSDPDVWLKHGKDIAEGKIVLE